MNKLFLKIKNKIKMWCFVHATPHERGNMLHLNYIEGCKVGTGCEIYTRYQPFGSEPYLVQIGNNVRITDGVKFCTHDGGMWVLRNSGMLENADFFGRIVVGDNVHIGWNSIIMPGVTIGHDTIIGCGAVVTKDIPPRSVAVGVPAKVVKTIDEYYHKNKDLVDLTKGYSESEKKRYLYTKFNLMD